MADNSFSRDPVEQLIVDATGGSAPDARSGIDDLARKSRVPANFLMAFSEASGAPDDAGKVKVASAVAAKIAPRLAAGEKIEDIVKSVAGDEAEASAFIERAYQIADELYPAPSRPKEDQPGVLGDMARSFGGSLVKGAGGMIEAAGIAAEEFADPVGAEFGQQPGPVRKGAKAAADLVRGFGERIQEGMSDDAKAAIKDSMPDGDLFSPSTWTVGKNASLRGYAMLATDVLGSFAPVVATAILTKNPAVAAGVGGLQGAGAAAETGRSIVEEAARTIGPDGKSLLEAGSPYYREALASGKSPEEALALTVAATERMAALLTAPISAFGGAATGKIIGKGFESLATKGPLGRILGTAVASSLEEGIQEAAETIATRYGTKSASGLDISLTEGTFGDFLLGALGGSLPGAVAGGFHGGGKDDQEEAPARPRAQPTPPLAEPTQGIDETPPPVAGNPTSPSPVTPPAPPAPAAPGAVIDPMADYLGKLTKFSAATKGAAIPAGSPASAQFDSLISGARRHGATEEEIDAALRLGTQPQPARPTRDIAATLPEPVFGKEVMGADVTVETGGMTPFIGKIIRDNGNTITIRDAEGDEIEVAHVQIERGEVILSAADAATPSIPAPQGSATNATGALTPATPVDPGALTLSQQAMTKITPPKLEDAAPITPEDAAKRMRFIESQAETSGWTEAMRKMHADLRAIAQPVTPTTATPDMGEVAVTPAAGSTPAPAAGEQLPAGPVAPKALDGEIITPEDDRRLEAEAAAAVGIEMTDAPVLTRAAWWDAADDDVRKAILDEAGPKAAAEYRRAMTFQKSSEDARRAISEAYGRLYLAGKIRNDGSIEAPKPVLAGPAQDAAKPIAQDAPAPGAAPEGPTGKTYRLDKGISDRHRKALAKFRGSTVDDIISQIDHNARRAEAQLRAKGIDIDDLDADGRDKAGQFHQEGVLIREAEALAADLLEEAIGKRSGDLGYPNKDEDTGEFENDGTPIGEALMWLDTFEAMGIGTDTITEDAPDIFDATRAIPEKPEAEIFPAVKGTVNIDAQAEREGEISLEDAKARVDFWKQTAKEIGKTGANSKKIIISLFDYTGAWSQPWADAGYQVIRHDIKSGSDIITDAWITEQIRERRQEGFEVYGVLSACPCTTFAGSGARWWEELHDVKSPEALAKVFGEKALSSGAKSALEYNLMLVQATRDVIAAANPTAFHVLENPIGRIEDKAGMPKPTARFHPHNFGDPYTKRTQLFGTFQTGLPTANVHPAEGSKMQSQLRGTDPLGKEARSTTPEGFSYAFFMANDPEARKRRGDQPKAAPVAPKAPTKAVEDTPQAALQLSIAPIRGRGAVLKGRPETEKPEVDGVPFTWDAKEAGWIFARRHTDKVAQALGIGKAADPAQQDAPQQALPGLDITVETPKGALRTGKDKDGETWSVKMPAHYGYIKRTTGADGDHVDVYLGENLDSDVVVIIDQKDLATGAFDEHKVMLGFINRKTALDFYVQGFSDGKGAERMGGHKVLTVAEFKAWLADGETTAPVRMPQVPPAASSATDAKADAKKVETARKKVRAKTELSLFVDAASSDAAISAAGEGTIAEFTTAIGPMLVKRILVIAEEYSGDERAAVLELVADGKPVLPETFFENAYKAARKVWEQRQKDAARDPQVKADAIEAAISDAGISGETEVAQFTAGFDHALSGKSKSTLPQGGKHMDGYDAARAWIKTKDGKAWFDGKPRQAKEKSTGDALRRVWDKARAAISDLDASDMDKAWKAVLKGTQRADLLPNVLPEDATPGAKAWFDLFRSNLATFPEYYSRVMIGGKHEPRRRYGNTAEYAFKGTSRSYRGLIADRFRAEGQPTSNSVTATDEQRLALTKEVADNYQAILQEVADLFAGARTLDDIAAVIAKTYGDPGAYGFPNDGPAHWLYADTARDLINIFPPKPGSWDEKYARWTALKKTEDAERAEGQRKDALIRPRLDRIERNTRDVRKGKSITAKELKRTFGFADVTIGEYVTAQEAEDHLNYAHDAFITLADMLGIKPEQIGFGGILHFTIGALGHGKFAAHFNLAHPDGKGGTVPVINVTKTRGDGTVLHEYFHAIDLLSTDPALKKAIAGVKKDLEETLNSAETIPEIAERFLTGRSSMTRMGRGATKKDHAISGLRYYRRRPGAQTRFYREAKKLDGGNVKEPYWSNDKELFARAAEAWGYDTLIAAQQRDDYLVSDWVAEGKVTGKTHRGTPYPDEAERARFVMLYKDLVGAMDWSSGRPQLKAGHPWHETPPHDDSAWKTAIDDAIRNIDQIESDMNARLAAEAAARVEADQKARDEALFGAQTDEVGPVQIEDAPLSEDDLSAIFDEESAAIREAAQEKPDDKEPGADIRTMEWTTDDAAHLLDLVEKGVIVLLADASIGLPTIHDIKGADHIGFGVFKISNAEYEGTFTAGGAMSATPSGKHYTTFSLSRGTAPFWDKDAAVAVLRRMAGLTEPQAKAPAAKPMPSLDAEADKTAGQLAAEFAKHGVSGLNESLAALTKLFGGGPNRLNSFPSGFDEDAYAAAKPHFTKAADEFRKAGLSFKDFVRVFFNALIRQFGDGVKPLAVRFAKEYQSSYEAIAPAETETAPVPVAADRTPEAMISDWVLARLREGEEISWQDLFKTADQSFGGSQAQGAYTPKDAYDAVELGVNRYLLDRKIGDPTVPLAEARNQIRRAEEVLALIPTQSKRTKEMDEFQQFSTPPHFAYLAAWAANMTGTDAFLEPSAGIGGLAVFAKMAGVQSVTVNELSARRLAVLRNLPFDAFYGENAEQLHNILPDQVKPTVIVMNPPFSATGGRIEGSRDTMNGARHIEQALKRLQPGGRLVAIVGQGMAADRPAFSAWWRKIRAEYNVRANIGLNGKTYAKYGTTFDTQVLVIDKSGPTAQDVVVGENLHPADALTLLESIRNDRPQATQPDQPLAGGTGRRPSGGEPETAAGAGVSGADLAADLGGGRIRADGQDNSTGTADAGMGAVDGDVRRPGRPGGIAQSGRSGDRGDAQPGGSADKEGSRSSGAGAADGSSVQVKVGTSAGAEQGTLTNSVFEPYRPKKVKIEGAVTHNTPLVESAALASVVPPDPTYTPNLPAAVVRKGLLSDAQLEAVVYAGQAHQQMLRDGSRRGFFLGDGTGVGKGRQISGIIMDNMRQGRKKAVWLSKKKELMADAQRDFADIGGDEKLIFSQANSKVGAKIMPKEGILFAGYATIRSQSKAAQTARKAAGGNRTAGEGGFLYERVKQIVDWVGKDFDGVLVFDEAHEMGNAVPVKGKRGVTKPSDQALAGLELQRALPKARVVYVSATGATEVQNLAYAQRLGLWGDGTAFSGGVIEFVNTMSRSVSAMELVAQNLKQMGLYLARSLSFDGVTYARLEHQLTDYQRDTYDLLASGWQTVLNNIDAALKDTGVLDDEGKNSGRNARSIKSTIMSQFWGAHQRFFNQIITASQMPSILDQIDADLAEGRAIVLQITNTNEADQERAIAKAKAGGGDEDGGDLEEMDLTPREMLIQFIDKSFPVNQHETYTDLDGNELIRVVHDSEGRPVVNKEAEARREQLKDAIRAMRIPDAPLQMLVDRFGAENIAEITGRKQRLVLDKDGKRKIEKRGNAAVQTDAQAFKDDKRRILVFSQAGGTGFSFHSDLRYKNKRQRAHYIVQAGWSADKAVQGFGRSHRTNQANSPIYRLVTTDIPAHKRFISSIARRLEQLGALTAGQRDTAGGSIFSATDNLESEYASAAVRMFFKSVTGAARPAEVPDDLLTQMGLAGIVDEAGSLNENNIPPTTQFLNRLLSLRLDTQKVVFDIFLQTMDAQIEIARRLGTFDDGLKSIRHVGAKVLTEQEVFRDEATNAPVRYFHIEYKTPNYFYEFDALPKSLVDNATRSAGYFRNKKSGRVAAIVSTGTTSTNDQGQIEGTYAVIRTSGTTYVRHSEVHVDNFERIDEAEARKLWDEENTKRPPNLDNDLHLVVGGILPIWDRFTSPRVDVTRIALDDGRRLLGRAIAPQDLAETLNNLDAKSAAAQMGGAGILAQIAKNKSVKLSNGWRIKPVTVSNERRAEIELSRGAAFMSRQQQDLLRNAGVIVERISWQERFFLPIDKPETVDAVLAAVNANVVAAEEQDDAIKESRFLAGDAITASAREINAELAKVGIAGRVTARLVDRLIGKSGALVAGRYRTGRIAVSAQSGDPLGVTRHEIVHALRDKSLWGRGNGLFTDAEWEGLVREARRHKDIRARVEVEYADADRDARNEEMVAELHRLWASGGIEVGKAASGLLARLRAFLTAVADVLRGRKVVDAAETLARIASGEIGARADQLRGPDDRFVAADAEMRPGLTGKGKTAADRLMRFWPGDKAGATKTEFDRNERTFLGNLLTNAMDGKGGVNLLALVPGRALFAELGKNMPSARAYLRHKEEMDAMRNEWHARTDETAQAWRKLIARDGAANAALMDLMHDATIAGVDPSAKFKMRGDNLARKAFDFVSEHGDAAPDWARALVEGQERRRMAHGPLAERFAALPPEFRAMFTRVRDSYDNLATAIEDAVIANAEKGMKVNIERAELRYKDALDQIRDDGLTGEDKDKAEAEAKEKLDEAKRRAAFSKGARIAALRAKFESNRLDGPYFPLARFGNFFVTVRDKESGKVLSFSRFEKEQDQKRAAAEWRAEDAYDVQIGTLADAKALRQQVDPSFVADIEDILGEAAADEGVMDMVWQRWLETLPDMSIRRTRLHRKGTPGYDTDAFRAFGRQMFHGAHQLARMSFAMDMSRNLEDARREAAQTSDPNRNGLIVNEMERRHEFTMNPKGGAWAQIASSAAFVYYLAVTPAAAAVNLSQTTIVGVPVLAAGFENGKIADAAAHILRASKDFLGGRFSVERSRTLTADEHRAMTEAYRRGTIDKSQAHDLAGVAETGVEYNDFRSRWMARLSFLFHHAERANREVTFLAAYRMAREHGMDHGNAIERAADLTWKTHFDYQNTSRPRLMQNDAAKVLLTFRNFTVNLNWRLFRDAHQMLKGATKEERREARTQLIGITAMMMLHAGITGTWGYTLITTLLGLFADDGDDDVEEALQSALVNTFGPQIAGILLKGVPGHLTGINLSERIGMPSLWFRESDRNLEGDDVYNYWLTELIGPVPGIVENTFRGVQMAWDGDVQRGVETVMPKAIRDIMQAYRYASEGVTTLSGNPILDDTSIADSFKKALGFSPARISERYEANTRLRNAEKRIEGERSDILSDAAREVMAGEPMSERVRRKIERFNRENPGYPIDGKTISRSVKARQRAVQEMEGGIRLNRRLNERLREEAAPPIYN